MRAGMRMVKKKKSKKTEGGGFAVVPEGFSASREAGPAVGGHPKVWPRAPASRALLRRPRLRGPVCAGAARSSHSRAGRKPATRPLDLSLCVCGHVQVGPNALRNAHSNRRKGSRRKSERPTKSGSVSAGTESACVSTTTARSRAWFRADPSGVTVPGMTGMMPRDRSFS